MKRLALIPAVLAVGVVLSTPVWAYPGQDQGDPCQQPESNCGHTPVKPTRTVTVTSTAYVPTTVTATTTIAGVPVTITSTATQTVPTTVAETVTEHMPTTVVETERETVTATVTETEQHTATETLTATETAREIATVTERHTATETAATTLTERETATETAVVTETRNVTATNNVIGTITKEVPVIEQVTATQTVRETDHQIVHKAVGYVVTDGSSRPVTTDETTGPTLPGKAPTDAALAYTGVPTAAIAVLGGLLLAGGVALLTVTRRRGAHR